MELQAAAVQFQEEPKEVFLLRVRETMIFMDRGSRAAVTLVGVKFVPVALVASVRVAAMVEATLVSSNAAVRAKKETVTSETTARDVAGEGGGGTGGGRGGRGGGKGIGGEGGRGGRGGGLGGRGGLGGLSGGAGGGGGGGGGGWFTTSEGEGGRGDGTGGGRGEGGGGDGGGAGEGGAEP